MIPHLYQKYIKGTAKNAIVQFVQVFLCNLTNAVVRGIDAKTNKVYINTRALKHLYDKRPAVEFDFLVENGHLIVKYPDLIYKNKTGKRGSFCFVKELKNNKYFCSLEIVEIPEQNLIQYEVATLFSVDDDYLKNYEFLWRWKDGDPSS